MQNHRPTVFLVIFTIVVSVITVTATLHTASQSPHPNKDASSNQQQQNKERDKGRLELERRFPVAEFGVLESTDTEEGAKRKIKSSRYDKHGFAIKDPSPRIAEQAVVTEWALHVAPLPAAKSDAIVIGEVLDARAHISNDRSAVYSEFNVRVGDALKGDGAASSSAGSLITIDRLGGIVRYPSGHQRLIRVVGQNMPRAGERYVLFLTTDRQSPNYRILTGYKLDAAGVSPLDESTRMDAYRGMDEATFLQAVRDAIAQSSQTTAQ